MIEINDSQFTIHTENTTDWAKITFAFDALWNWCTSEYEIGAHPKNGKFKHIAWA